MWRRILSRISVWLHREATHVATAHFLAEVEKQRASREEVQAAAQGLQGAAKRLTESANKQRGRIEAQFGDRLEAEGAARTSDVRQLVESALLKMEAAELRRTHR